MKSYRSLMPICVLAIAALSCSAAGRLLGASPVAPSETPWSLLQPATAFPPTAAPEAPAEPAAPSTVHLTADGSGDYPTLPDAIEALSPGGMVVLEAGTYSLTEQLIVTKPLTMLGAGMGQTIVSGTAGPSVLKLVGPGAFALEGITFEYQGTDPARVVHITDGEIHVEDCRFTGGVWDEANDMGGAGLQTYGTTTGTVRDSRADHNQLSGIVLRDQSDLTLDGNIFTNNEQSGVVFFEQSTGLIQNNESTFNGLHGFGVNEQSQPQLMNNICSNNAEAGIRFSDDAGGTARGNTCESNGLSGIIVRLTAHPTLVSNTLTHNGEGGIAYFGDAAGSATDNICTGNKWGIHLAQNSHPDLSDNVTTGNSSANIHDIR